MPKHSNPVTKPPANFTLGRVCYGYYGC